MTKKKRLIIKFIAMFMVVSLIFTSDINIYAKSKEGWRKTSGKWWYEFSDGSYAHSEYIDGYWLDSVGWYDATWNGSWKKNSKGWWFESGSWYPTNSWLKINKKWYHFAKSGYMDSDKWIGNYYVQPDGSMATNKWIGKYYVGEDGKWIPNYSENKSRDNSNNSYNYQNGNNNNNNNYYDNGNGNSNNEYQYETDEVVTETTDDKLITYAEDYIYIKQAFAPIKNPEGLDVSVDDLNSANYSDDELDAFTKDYNLHYTYVECPTCGRKYWSDKDGEEGVSEARNLYCQNDLCRRFELIQSELDTVSIYTNDGNGYVGKTNREYYLDKGYSTAYLYRQYVDVNSNEGQRYYYDTQQEADRNGVKFYRGYPFLSMSNKNKSYEYQYYNIKQVSIEDIVVEKTYVDYAYSDYKELKSFRWWRKSNPDVVYNSLKTTYDSTFVDEKGNIIDAPQIDISSEVDASTYGDYLNSTISPYVETEDPNKAVVEGYSYSIEPIFEDVNMYYYVKTDNPDPESFTFIDRDSKYYTDSSAYDYISVLKEVFSDVDYEDESIRRVNGGYIFRASSTYYTTDEIDGGEMILRYKMEDGRFEDSDVTVICPEVKPLMVYLEDKYTEDSMTLFEKIKAVDKGIASVSLYPDGILDKNSTSSEAYPYLTSVSYDDQGVIWGRYVTYSRSTKVPFLARVYPFTLDSKGQPNMVASFANYLNNDIVCSETGVHYLYNLEYNGETITVGGAGRKIRSDAYFSSDIEKCFFFDGSENDLSHSVTYEKALEKKQLYNELSYTYFEANKQKIRFDTIAEVLGYQGSWVRIYGGYYSYLYYDESPNRVQKMVSVEGDVWVDGRYLNKRGRYIPGTKFSDTPGSYMIIKINDAITFDGITYKGETRFRYLSDYDMWTTDSMYWDLLDDLEAGNSIDNYPDELIITREEADAMEIDKNTDVVPQNGFIYDGTVEPGTPFEN